MASRTWKNTSRPIRKCSCRPLHGPTSARMVERIRKESLMHGMLIGVYNSPGAHWRGEGGDQERELAAKYRKWGQALQSSHPYVASVLLMGLARSYEADANREDTEAGIRRRLR